MDSLARGYTEIAVRTIGGIMKDGTTEELRLNAANIMLDRGWGKPKQDTKTSVSGELRVTLRKMLGENDE